jgi:flagellar biosynthesis/type III secretory pathway protein FliH
VKLATAIAARVIRREVMHHPEITLALVRESLELAAGSTHIRLRLHPEDLAQLGGFVERITQELAPAGTTEMVADAAVEQGGCRLETSLGTIDQQFAAQLARIEEELGY